MALARRAHPRFRLRRISVAGFALSVFSCTGFGKQASLFPCLKILSVSLPTRKKRPSHRCAKGECLAVPPFLMLLSRISQRSFNGDRTGRLTVKVQPVGSKATFHTCFPTDSSQPVGNLSLAVLWYVLLFLTTFFFFRYSLYHSRGFFICQEGVFISPSIYAQISSLPCLVSAEKGMITGSKPLLTIQSYISLSLADGS